ncbi:MAG: hypothetical protein AVDCRST_MAG73-3918, partial [uncultured Thermomicrobiales bacterium]
EAAAGLSACVHAQGGDRHGPATVRSDDDGLNAAGRQPASGGEGL